MERLKNNHETERIASETHHKFRKSKVQKKKLCLYVIHHCQNLIVLKVS